MSNYNCLTMMILRKCRANYEELTSLINTDCLVPYKHYASEVISGVLDGIISPDDEDSADFPCEMTIRRWHCWLEANRLRIDGYLKSAGYRLLGFSTELLGSRVPLLDKLRSSQPEWLETLLRFLYNSGGFLVPV